MVSKYFAYGFLIGMVLGTIFGFIFQNQLWNIFVNRNNLPQLLHDYDLVNILGSSVFELISKTMLFGGLIGGGIGLLVGKLKYR